MIVGSITILLYTVYNNIIIIILYALLENLTDDAIAWDEIFDHFHLFVFD